MKRAKTFPRKKSGKRRRKARQVFYVGGKQI